MVGIIRDATVDEKKDFIEVKHKNRNPFQVKLADRVLKHTKDHTPICSRCAQLDYRDKIERVKTELGRSQGIVQGDEDRIKRLDFNLDDYARLDRFELLEVSEVKEPKIIDGQKVFALTGMNENFKCKKRGCGITVFTPIGEWNEKHPKDAPKNPTGAAVVSAGSRM